MRTYIPVRWREKLKMLPPQDFKKLITAIMDEEEEPKISAKYQPIAHDIYLDILEMKRNSGYQRKFKEKSYSNLPIRFEKDLNKISVRQEKELPPTPPIEKESIYVKGDIDNLNLSNSTKDIVIPYTDSNTDNIDIININNTNTQNNTKSISNTTPPIVPPAKPKTIYTKQFEELWTLYPKKEGKKPAFEAYQRAVRAGAKPEDIKAGIERYRDKLKREGTTEQYTLQGATFFNQRRWEDDYSPTSKMTAEDMEDYHAIFG